jgi:glycine cleavage system H protein
MAEYPESYRYTKEHEWVSVDGDVGTVGITDHAQNELGDVVYLELPEVGDRIEAGKPFGTIESVKAVSDLYAPVSGEITEVHSDLIDAPEIVNDDPHAGAWMIRVRLDDAADLEGLWGVDEYKSFLEETAE